MSQETKIWEEWMFSLMIRIVSSGEENVSRQRRRFNNMSVKATGLRTTGRTDTGRSHTTQLNTHEWWTYRWWWLSSAGWWRLRPRRPPAGWLDCFWPPSCQNRSTGSDRPAQLAYWHSGSPWSHTGTVTESHALLLYVLVCDPGHLVPAKLTALLTRTECVWTGYF